MATLHPVLFFLALTLTQMQLISSVDSEYNEGEKLHKMV